MNMLIAYAAVVAVLSMYVVCQKILKTLVDKILPRAPPHITFF